ncbi:MAG TPA: hypothetical protein VGB30_07595 [bacterium]
MTDNNEYPHYLLGGDIDGWNGWHEKWDGLNSIDMDNGLVASNEAVVDPLIENGYLSSYPGNPFSDSGRDIRLRTNVDGTNRQGEGDPRFGYKGNTMGMGLDDINFFMGAVHTGPFLWSDIETRRTLDRGEFENVPDEFKHDIINVYYHFGGLRSGSHVTDTVFTFWPGNFFYKATADTLPSIRDMVHVPNTHIGGHYNRYILGGYGAEGTTGTDVIRLEYEDPEGKRLSWNCPPDQGKRYCWDLGYELISRDFGSSGGIPEVFGGGYEWEGPYYPYDSDPDHLGEFIYGAPDGVPDGVIIVLTNGVEQDRYAL